MDYIVLVGHSEDTPGQAYGPFEDYDAAAAFADTVNVQEPTTDWVIVNLHPQEEYE